jgi:MoaA/NifB/PqqE/SkfB family radical SAM enzyme
LSIRLHNIVRMASSSVAARALGRRRPLNIMLAVTDRCTGGCVYCRIPQRKTPEMSYDEIAALLAQAARLGCQRIGLWGGEPLCREDLGAIVREVRRHGMFVTVDTNGHLLPERGEQVREVDHLNIALDGDRTAHDAARGAGTFDRTLRGIVHAAGRHRFWTITVLSRLNLGEVDWILDLARRLNFLTTFQVLHHNDTLGHNDGWMPDDRELRQVLRQLVARKKEGAPIALSLGYLERMLQWPDYTKTRLPSHPAYPPCLAGKLYCNVDVDGRLYPCSLLVGEPGAPDARALGLERAFEAMAPPPCQACTATCFTEYNLLFGLDWRTGLNWVRALRRS